MSRQGPDLYRQPPPYDRHYNGPCDRVTVARLIAKVHQLEHELDISAAQVVSLTAENTRLRALLPREALKSRPKPTRREKIEQAAHVAN